MQYIELLPKQMIMLRVKDNRFTPTQALNEAINYLKDNDCHFVYLDYLGYAFNINESSSIEDLMREYYDWDKYKDNKTKDRLVLLNNELNDKIIQI
jgi:hypothetical protein